MTQTREMFDAMTAKTKLDVGLLSRAVEALQNCEELVAACAMGMLAEQDAMQLAQAISRDLDCADVVGVTRQILTRGSGPDSGLLKAQLEACVMACERSNELCSQHAGHHVHCRLCSEATSSCMAVCREVLAAL